MSDPSTAPITFSPEQFSALLAQLTPKPRAVANIAGTAKADVLSVLAKAKTDIVAIEAAVMTDGERVITAVKANSGVLLANVMALAAIGLTVLQLIHVL